MDSSMLVILGLGNDLLGDDAVGLLAAERCRGRFGPDVAVRMSAQSGLYLLEQLEDCDDAILLDSGNPALAVKELGGTGRRHDWGLSRSIRESVGVPVWLAGGLTPENVTEAIAKVSPFGLDVCSGVRREGGLDETTLGRFFAAVSAAS